VQLGYEYRPIIVNAVEKGRKRLFSRAGYRNEKERKVTNMQTTPNYGLAQWELSDRIRMEDFNRDNLKIDTSMFGLDTSLSEVKETLSGISASVSEVKTSLSGLDTSLSGISTVLTEKLGRAVEYAQAESTGRPISSSFLYCPIEPWNQWEYVTMAVRFPNTAAEESSVLVTIPGGGDNSYQVTLPTQAFDVIFCPRHDDTRKVSGLILCRTPILFSCDFIYQNVQGISLKPASGQVLSPSHLIIGTP